MWCKIFILIIQLNILFASPPGSRDGASYQSYQKKWNSQDGKKTQASTISSRSYPGSEPQHIPLDLSTKNRQMIQYASPSTSGIRYDCTKCDKQYTAKYNLERHDRVTHQGIKYDCTKCGEKFSRKDTLEIHDRAKHQGRTYDCTKCGQSFTTKRSLQNHEKAKHEENSEFYNCDKCPYQTKHKSTFSSHKSRNH